MWWNARMSKTTSILEFFFAIFQMLQTFSDKQVLRENRLQAFVSLWLQQKLKGKNNKTDFQTENSDVVAVFSVVIVECAHGAGASGRSWREHADEGNRGRMNLLCIAANGSCLQWISIAKVGLEGPGTIWWVSKCHRALQWTSITSGGPWPNKWAEVSVSFEESDCCTLLN